MNAAEYNVQEILAGRITAAHLMAFTDANKLVAAVKEYQKHRRLLDDGKIGPKTRASLEQPEPVVAKPSVVYQPMHGGCFWSMNAFNPGHHDGRDGFQGPKGDHGWPNSGGKMIIAIADGVVTKCHTQTNGFWVEIDHGHGLVSLSGHLLEAGYVKKGDKVRAGDELGPLLSTIHPPHIHFQIELSGKLVDPVKALEKLGAIVCESKEAAV